MPVTPGGDGDSSPKATTTVDQLFTKNKWLRWWDITPTKRFNARPGSNDCTDKGATEFGTDYPLACGTNIRNIVPGKVVYAQRPPEYPAHPSIGYVIQIAADDGPLIHYQHMNTTAVRVGDRVTVGSLIGLSGGAKVPGDKWSTGCHIEVRYAYSYKGQAGQPWCNADWQDSHPIFQAIGTSLAGTNVATGKDITSTTFLGQSAQLIGKYNPLNPNESVSGFLTAVNAAQVITNPFITDTSSIQSSLIPGQSFTDPIKYIQIVAGNTVQDMGAFVFDFILVGGGIFLCFKVFARVVNLSGILSTAGKVAGTAAMFA
jgi:murein DD-endopeptidase MepM/ murein hydrolase activator NlpD